MIDHGIKTRRGELKRERWEREISNDRAKPEREALGRAPLESYGMVRGLGEPPPQEIKC